MSFVPQMQNYFGKGTDFAKLSSAYGDSAALGVKTDIEGDVIKDEAEKRAAARGIAGDYMKSQGQAAGSAAVTGGFIDGATNVAGGFLKGGLKDGGFFRGTPDTGSSPFAFDSSSIPSSAYTEGVGYGGYSPSEILNMPNIGYNPFSG